MVRPVEEAKAKERADAGRKKGGETAGKGRPKKDSSKGNSPRAEQQARDKAAKAAGTSARTLKKIKEIVASGYEDLIQAIDIPVEMDGHMSVDRAHRTMLCRDAEKNKPRTPAFPANPPEAVTLAGALERYFAEQARERQKEHGKTAPGRPGENTSGNFPEVFKGRARDRVGEAVGMSGQSPSRAEGPLGAI